MSKYKVGDVVRIKEMAGMIRSPYSGMSAKVVALYEFPERLNYFYILDVDMGRHAWSEDMLDDPKEEAKVELSIYDISESEGDFTIMLSDLLKKEYYEKMKLSAGSLKAKYNSILFIYNYLTSKIKSVREYMLKENVQIKSKQPE